MECNGNYIIYAFQLTTTNTILIYHISTFGKLLWREYRKIISKVTRISHCNTPMENNMQPSIPFNGCETGLGNSISAFWNPHFPFPTYERLQCSSIKYLKQKLNQKVHSTAVAILSCKEKKKLLISYNKQILMCPAILATAAYLCNLHLILWYSMTEHPKN